MIQDFYEQVVGLVRTTGLTESNWQYRRYLTEMESLPSRPPSVEGWPQDDDKINSLATDVAIVTQVRATGDCNWPALSLNAMRVTVTHWLYNRPFRLTH